MSAEQQQIFQLFRNELLAITTGQQRELTAKLDALQSSTDKIDKHLESLNSRTRKNEEAISRLNLVTFSIGGPSTLLVAGALIKYFFGL